MCLMPVGTTARRGHLPPNGILLSQDAHNVHPGDAKKARGLLELLGAADRVGLPSDAGSRAAQHQESTLAAPSF